MATPAIALCSSIRHSDIRDSPVADFHPIRLRGPWQYQVLSQCHVSTGTPPLAKIGELPPPGKVQMPADWESHLGSDFRGCVRYVRNFGCPTALEPHETVFLVLEGVDALGRVELNGEQLGEITLAAGTAKFEITELLQERNELVVEVELPIYASAEAELLHRGDRSGQPGGLFGEVRLEIWNGR